MILCTCGIQPLEKQLNDAFKVYAVHSMWNTEYEVSVYSSKSDCWLILDSVDFCSFLYNKRVSKL